MRAESGRWASRDGSDLLKLRVAWPKRELEGSVATARSARSRCWARDGRRFCDSRDFSKRLLADAVVVRGGVAWELRPAAAPGVRSRTGGDAAAGRRVGTRMREIDLWGAGWRVAVAGAACAGSKIDDSGDPEASDDPHAPRSTQPVRAAGRVTGWTRECGRGVHPRC